MLAICSCGPWKRLTPQGYARLMEVLGQYPVLARAWRLKEAFRAWYGCGSRAEAEARLARWQDGLEPFKGLLPMLRIWHNEILNYFDHRYTNGYRMQSTLVSRPPA